MGTAAVKQCSPPDPDLCKELLDKIYELIYRDKRTAGGGGTHGLEHRFEEQINGKHGPGTPEWDNHENEIKKQQEALRKKLRDFEKNFCGDPPSGAWKWASRPVPQTKEWKDPNMETLKKVGTTTVEVGVGIGVGYLIYRGIRMLPSLFPLLWPTIPANLAIP